MVAFTAYWVQPSFIFAALWLAYALCFWVSGWSHGISIVTRTPMLVDWKRNDTWILRLTDGNKLKYWAIRSMYGFPAIIAMVIYYKQPWLLAIGLLPQTIGLFGWAVSKVSQSANNWRVVEFYMGALLGVQMILTMMALGTA